MNSSPPGGPATISGIVYQLLWSLFCATEIRVHSTDISMDGSVGSQATLILEPRGGGDIQVVNSEGRAVQQLKVGSHSWSLRSLITDVLPDLYLSVNVDQSGNRYQFITEGWMGDWQEVAAWFSLLREKSFSETSVLDSLDDGKPLRFRHKNDTSRPFWSDEGYTERSLFVRIAQSLREDSPTINGLKETENILYSKLWHLLARFEFVPDQSASEIQSKIDRLLMEMVPTNTGVKEKRDALLLDMARRAAQGNAIISAEEFFRDHNLNSIPLSDWKTLIQNSSRSLDRRVKILRYLPVDDVRDVLVPERWPMKAPLLAVVGESGQGKSWSLYRLAKSLSNTNPVVLIEAKKTAQENLELAARDFANIAEQDEILRIERVAARLRSINSPRQQLWMYLLIDGVEDAQTARELALQDWEEWGIALVVSGHPDAMRVFADTAGGRGEVFEVKDFTPQQAERYLANEVPEHYYAIPGDVRETLRRPLLTRLYRDITREGYYVPRTEYELYSCSWDEMFRKANIEDRLAEPSLQRLALTLFDGASYPWSKAQITDAGITSDQLAFLIHQGALVEATEGRLRIWHDRLLNWLVALSLAGAWRDRHITAHELIDRVVRLWTEPYTELSRQLSYVCMDVIWLLARSANESDEILAKLFAAIDSVGPFDGKEFYSQLLPPIGHTIVPAVLQRIEERTAEDPWCYTDPLSECIAAFDVSVTEPICFQLLKSDRYGTLRAACHILQRRPIKSALEPLWALLQDIHLNREKYHPGNSSWAFSSSLATECMGALRACVPLDPDWLEEVILYREANSESIMFVAYILPDLPEGEARCRRCQARLQKVLAPHQTRAVAEIIYRYPDPSAALWLQQHVPEQSGLAGATSLRALMRLDATIALEALDKLPEDDLYGTREWCLLPLLITEPEKLKERFLSMLQSSAKPLRLLDAFQGFEDELSVDHLNVALDALEQRLVEASNLNLLDYNDLWRPLERINAANSLEALGCLKLRRGSMLEQKLTEWMLFRSPRQGLWVDHLGQAGIEMLYRIGGEGFTQVVNAWIGSDLPYGRIDGLEVAFKRPDRTTIQILQHLMEAHPVMEAHPDGASNLRLQRCLVVRALARADQWKLLVEAILVCGFETPHDISYARSEMEPLDDEHLAPCLSILSSGDLEKHPGAILALGIRQREDFENPIVEILGRSQPKSNIEKACLLALSLIKTKEDATA